MIEVEFSGLDRLVMEGFEHLSQQLSTQFGVQVAPESLLVGYGLVLGSATVGWLIGTATKTRQTTTAAPDEEVDSDPAPTSDAGSEPEPTGWPPRPTERTDGGIERDSENEDESTQTESTDEQSADHSTDTTRPMTTPRLPTTATDLVEQPDHDHSPIEDNDPKAALELLRDALLIAESSTRPTALQRGSYDATIGAAPNGWAEPSTNALHLRCVTNTIVPNANDPGTTVQSFATVWIRPVRVVREIVTDQLGADAFERFTPPKEDGERSEEQESGR